MTWTQPYGLTCLLARTRRGHVAWREFQIWTFACTLNFLAFWLVACLRARYDPDIKPMSLLSALAFSLQGGLMVACLYQLHWLVPSGVVLNDEGISIVEANVQRWRYDQIAWVRIDTIRKRARVFRLMLMVFREGREVVVGIPAKVELPGVLDFLRGKGVAMADAEQTPQDHARTYAGCGMDTR